MGRGEGEEAHRDRPLKPMTDDGTPAAEERLKVVFCGGCNPHIDRTAIAAGLPVHDPDVAAGTTVHISGCPRACASGHALVIRRSGDDGRSAGGAPHESRDAGATVVAGELVDGVPTPRDELVAAITRKLKE